MVDSGFSAPSLEQTPTSEHSGFPRVSVLEEIGEPLTKERSRVVDEKVHRQLEEHIDPETGKKFLTTTETVEQTVEHEVKVSQGFLEGLGYNFRNLIYRLKQADGR